MCLTPQRTGSSRGHPGLDAGGEPVGDREAGEGRREPPVHDVDQSLRDECLEQAPVARHEVDAQAARVGRELHAARGAPECPTRRCLRERR